MTDPPRRRKSKAKPRTDRPKPTRPLLDRYWAFVLMVLFAAALAWRLDYLARLFASPLAETLRGDERVYWDWATFLLGHGLRGTNAFFLGPLYPYFLALARSVLGSQIRAVLVLQATLGSAAVVLLADAARRQTRPVVALMVGGLVAFYEMNVLFEGLILSESLIFFLQAVLIWLWCGPIAKPASTITLASMGLVTGLIAEGRATGALLLVPCVWLACRVGSPSRRQVLKRAGVVLAAFGVVTLPGALWNRSASGEFIPFTYNFGYNLLVGNNKDADGGFVFVAGANRLGAAPEARSDGGAELDGRAWLEKMRGLKLSPAQSSAYWSREAMRFVREHPGRTAQLFGKKFLMMWNFRETPQLESADLFRREAGPLGLPILGTFLIIGILGLTGFFCVGFASPVGAALRLYVLAQILGLLPFFVTDRYRVHLTPALAVLSAFAIQALLAQWKTRPPRGLAPMAGVMLGATALVMFPLPARERGIEDWLMSRELGTRWLEQDRPDLAAHEFENTLALEGGLGLAQDPDRALVEARALFHYNYAAALHQLGQFDAEIVLLRTAAEEDPQNAHYLRTLADACFISGRKQEGDSLIRRLSGLVGGESEALVSQGWEAAREGRRAEAEDFFRRAVAADQRMYGAWGALIRIQVEQSRWAAAESSLARAAQAGMRRSTLLAHEALLRAASGDAEGARRALAEIPDTAIESDRVLAGVVSSARRLLAKSGPSSR